MSTLKYSGTFDSGIKYEVHTMQSFSGMEELALFVEAKPVTIITVERKKNGGVEIKPVMNVKIRLGGKKDAIQEEPSDAIPPRPEATI